ncbi:hypothetical protein [Bosea psychrotolerans]|uniref:hypothetical protein n=1 Tax=Bosea psychrotolerans TaxID=1871628 RepID=UPI000CDB1191|nr:hypothetical protein [Bosea psychrotolerans]
MLQEVPEFGDAARVVEHLLVQRMRPGQILARRLGVERDEVGEVGEPVLRRRLILAEAFRDQERLSLCRPG